VTLDRVEVRSGRPAPAEPHHSSIPRARPSAPDACFEHGAPGEPSLFTKGTLDVLSAGVALLAFLNGVNDGIGRPFWTVTRYIYLGDDQNVAAWYSSILLISAAALALECWIVSRARGARGSWSFALVGGLLAAMSCDEIVRFHEGLGDVASRFYGAPTLAISRHAAWVWIGGPVIIAAFVFFVLLLRKPLRASPGAFPLVLSGFGAIVLGGVLLEATTNWLNHDHLQRLWNAEVIAEETLEMAGTMLIAYGLLRWRTITVRSGGGPANPV
jgi:hypothetical protein